MTKTTKTAVPPLVDRLEDVSSWLGDAIEALCRKSVLLNEDQLDRVIEVWYDLQTKQADLFTKWQTCKGLKRLNQTRLVVSRDGKVAQKLTAKGTLTGRAVKRAR